MSCRLLSLCLKKVFDIAVIFMPVIVRLSHTKQKCSKRVQWPPFLLSFLSVSVWVCLPYVSHGQKGPLQWAGSHLAANTQLAARPFLLLFTLPAHKGCAAGQLDIAAAQQRYTVATRLVEKILNKGLEVKIDLTSWATGIHNQLNLAILAARWCAQQA